MKKFVSILLTAAMLMSFILMGMGSVSAEEQTIDVQITSTIMMDEIYRSTGDGIYAWMTYGKFDAVVNGEELKAITVNEFEMAICNAYGVPTICATSFADQYESPWEVGNTYSVTIEIKQYVEETETEETVLTLNPNVMVHETLVESVAVQPIVLYKDANVYKDLVVVINYKDGSVEKAMGGYSKDWEYPTEVGTYDYTINHGIYGELPVSIQVLEVPTSGKCGENLNWAYDTDTKKLTISGTGDMYEIAPDLDTFWEYSYTYEPEFWYCDVKDIVVEEGVTGLPNFAFGWLNQETLQLPTTLKAIPDMWLTVSTAMTSLEIPEGVTALTGWPFGSPGNSFTAVTELYLPSTIQQLDKMTVMLSGINSRNGTQTLETVYFAGTQEQWDAVEFVESEGTLKEIYGADYEEGTIEFCEAMRERFANLNVSITGEISVEDGIASVPDEAIKVIEGEDVVIDVSKEAEKVESAVIGAAAVEKITDAETGVEIKLSDASVALDAAAVKTIAQQAGDAGMTVVAKKIEKTELNSAQQAALEEENVCMVLNLEAYAGDTKVSSFGGGLAKISVPYTLAAGQDGSELYVAYVADNGEVSVMSATYADGMLTFVTSHFSSYVVLEKSAAAVTGVTRVFGATRYDTAFDAANMLKERLGVSKFDTIVVACGTDFADALSGSYLANQKNAPILLVRNRKQEIDQVKDYIKANLKTGGTVYLLGGTNAIPKSMETGLDGFTVKRLAGATRYETSLAIIQEAGVGDKDILVCTGKNFADGLSASAVNMPIMLVKDSLSDSQKTFLQGLKGNKIVIIGGTAAVNTRIENALKAYGTTERIEGATRYYTSVNIAKKYFPNATSMVVAYADNFPDGLSGGPVAYSLNAPLILTMNGKQSVAVNYAKEMNIKSGMVLGGTTLISDSVVKQLFSMGANDVIQVK